MSTNILRRHPSTPPGPPPHRRRAAPGPWTSSSGRSGFQSEIRYLIPRCETSQSFCGPWALLPAARGRLPADGLSGSNRLCLRRRQAPPASPSPVPPVTHTQTGAMPDPGSGDPYRVNVGGGDVCTGHPEILDAVPASVTRLPDIYPGLGGAGTASTTGAGGAMPTTTPTRARPGTAVRVRAAAQRNGMIARRLAEQKLIPNSKFRVVASLWAHFAMFCMTKSDRDQINSCPSWLATVPYRSDADRQVAISAAPAEAYFALLGAPEIATIAPQSSRI